MIINGSRWHKEHGKINEERTKTKSKALNLLRKIAVDDLFTAKSLISLVLWQEYWQLYDYIILRQIDAELLIKTKES